MTVNCFAFKVFNSVKDVKISGGTEVRFGRIFYVKNPNCHFSVVTTYNEINMQFNLMNLPKIY